MENMENMVKNKKYNLKNIIEPFDGIRKDNSRVIFGFLLTIIMIDIVIDCFIA